jgi:hypothetical protein
MEVSIHSTPILSPAMETNMSPELQSAFSDITYFGQYRVD